MKAFVALFNIATKNYQHYFIDSFIYIFNNNDLLSIVGIILEINYTSMSKMNRNSCLHETFLMWCEIRFKKICLMKYVSMPWTLALIHSTWKIQGRKKERKQERKIFLALHGMLKCVNWGFQWEKHIYVKDSTRLGWVGLRNVAHL